MRSAQLPTVPFSLLSLHSAPAKLQLGLYERTFFSDNRIGDLELPLNGLSEDKYALFKLIFLLIVFISQEFSYFILRSVIYSLISLFIYVRIY